jgi:hypothetical protein
MRVLPVLLIAAGVVFVMSAFRGTKPASIVLSGKDDSGKPIKARDRIAWAILGTMLIVLGAVQLMIHRSH